MAIQAYLRVGNSISKGCAERRFAYQFIRLVAGCAQADASSSGQTQTWKHQVRPKQRHQLPRGYERRRCQEGQDVFGRYHAAQDSSFPKERRVGSDDSNITTSLTRKLHASGKRLVVAVTNKGLHGALGWELLRWHGTESSLLGGRVCFPWEGCPEGPLLHGASRVVPLFALQFRSELARMLQTSDIRESVADFAEQSSRQAIHSVLSEGLRNTADERPLRFNVRCRASTTDAAMSVFDGKVEWADVKAALRDGVHRATGWTLESRSCDVEATIMAFIGPDHIALGVEAPEPDERRDLRFSWRSVPRAGMETQLAGAMAALATEGLAPQHAVIVDPACGMGTLLLAAARVWPRCRDAPQLIGRDLDRSKIQRSKVNFAACGLDASHITVGDSRCAGSIVGVDAAGADAVLCDLPCGAAHQASADGTSYDAIMQEASRILRPGGRCVVLSTRRQMLARAVETTGLWKSIAAWSVGRGLRNRRESQLVVLERSLH